MEAREGDTLIRKWSRSERRWEYVWMLAGWMDGGRGIQRPAGVCVAMSQLLQLCHLMMKWPPTYPSWRLIGSRDGLSEIAWLQLRGRASAANHPGSPNRMACEVQLSTSRCDRGIEGAWIDQANCQWMLAEPLEAGSVGALLGCICFL